MDIKDLLLKRAMGFEVEEVIEEYNEVDGDLILSKKKVTKKFIPPDSIALKFLLTQSVEEDNSSYENLSYNELLALKDELLEQINDLTKP
ncbi:MAG: hypothetical protein IJZ29_00545 [Clostridia bacterium]|nr:hypothetical protein [Clostridia bacterium]